MNRLFSDHAHVRNNRFERACVMCNYALACCNNNRFKLDGVAADAVVLGTSVNSCGIRQRNNSLELMRAVMSLRARRRPRTLIGHCSVFTSGHRYATQCRYILYYQLTIAQTSREASTSPFFFAGPQYNSGVPQRIRKNIPKSRDVGFRAL